MKTNKVPITTQHAWHGVHPGPVVPQVVNAIIEIPQHSKGKYELDKASGLLKLDRVLFSSVTYPANYGFIPQTYGGDHDPLDILVLSQIELPHLCLCQARVIGVMRMTDQGALDDKIIAVLEGDMSVAHIREISNLPPHTETEIRRFFMDYKKLEGKEIVVEQFQSREVAYPIIETAIQFYKETFGPIPG